MKKIFFFTILISSVLIISGCVNQPKVVNVNIIPDEIQNNEAVPVATTPTLTDVAEKTVPPLITTPPPAAVIPPVKETAQIPATFLMKIAFAQQAPFGNWDEAHEEACEEASIIMAAKYLKQETLNEQIMEEELQKLLAWQNERGYKVDLTAQETVEVLKNYFGLASHLSRSVTVDQIKYELSQGRPIIIPAAGRVLGNPNFKQPGPLYHMLVIKGYDSKNFITNDPGTRNGNSYAYPYDRLIFAIHDWNHDFDADMTEAQMLKGEKVMIVVDKS